MKYDYVFVGAGPANLAAANILLQRGRTNILILEEGNAFKRRGCPGLRQSLCSHCNGELCHVVGGEGGSSALFGNKLCYFPASSRILEFFEPETAATAIRYLDGLLSPQFQSRQSQVISPVLTDDKGMCPSPMRKDYTSDVLLKAGYEQLIHKLLSAPRNADVIRVNAAVTDIAQATGSRFRVTTDSGAMVEADHVILGCGRASYRFLDRVFASLGVECEQCLPDIGIRLEAPREMFTREFSYQGDPKYKFEHLTFGTSRTFCGCHGGIIVPVKFGDAYYADGAFGDSFAASSNLAFMVRAHKPLPIDKLEQWCRDVNSVASHGLLLGELPLDCSGPEQLAAAIGGLIPYWPTGDHQIMITELLKLTLGGRVTLLKQSTSSTSPVKVFGPAIDMYWPRPKLLRDLETCVPGLYVSGDAAGVSRGIVQAMVSGVAWAMSHQARPARSTAVHSFQKEPPEWSVLA